MNEEVVEYSHSRSVAKAHWIAKLNHYRDLLVRKWWVLVGGVALGLLVVGAIAWYQPSSFVSLGRMIVSIKLAIPEGSVYNEELSNFLGTQAALMQSGVVVNRAHARVLAQHPSLTNQPVALKVTVSPKTSIFVLEATGADPQYSQAFLQACMEEYINLKKEMRAQTSDTTVAGLTEEALRLEKELRSGEDDMVHFQRSNSVVILEEQGSSTANYLAALHQRLAALKSEYDLLQALTLDQNLERRQEVSASLPPPSDPAGTSGAVGGDRADADYLKAKQQILLLKADQQDLGQYFRAKHPKMLALSDEISRRERLLEIFRQQSAEQLDGRKQSLVLQIQNLEKDLKEWDGRALDIQRKSAEYQKLKANSVRIQALYDRLLATLQTLDVNKEISPESVTIMEPASRALADKAGNGRRLVIACLVSLGLGIGLLLFLDRLDDRVNSFTELEDLFDETVLGQIPREKSQGKRAALKLIAPDDERHAFVEAYRNLRSSLLYAGEAAARPRTLIITSSIPNEGKSVTSANLAILLAHSGARVLLVDADLRKGILHVRFGLQAEFGLSEVLRDRRDWERAVQTTPCPNLYLIPRGGVTHQSSELFIGGAITKFLKAAADQYDYVLLDTAPVMAADDVTSLAPHADAVLFVLRAEHTSARVAHAALDLLYQRRARVLGIVFNSVRPRSTDYYYYYQYKDYYASYPSKEGKTDDSKVVKA
ncbi:MAG TPA: polysaccharide biosynthesis tyrosine autokinase [Candidatus Acidoferrum sp.]|jgi:succinoglycan biosynthesis transport protein ExoP|nr:polysaccharide biosynthesis tyrosine autokinase [Candidatus Acidoferrum sp.]